MPDLILTDEQQQVVQHPIGRHARVLAVAGSGKSITLAYRVKFLLHEIGVSPGSIRILMFNNLARKNFRKHLRQIGVPESMTPEVDTFHSFSYRIIKRLMRDKVLPELIQFWLGDKEELIWLTVKRAINNLEMARRIPKASIDPDQAMNAISLWKGALIPPDRAGAYNSPNMPLVYAEFERLRLEKSALTFDDFVPLAVELLAQEPKTNLIWHQKPKHVIVDEYQDINYGQQQMIELLAGNDADVMVVGDDDQTIYEWRGARPAYIVQDFPQVFDNKPVDDYYLTKTFRFGPLLAKCAANLIMCNQVRVKKPLVAYNDQQHGYIHVFNGSIVATKELADQVEALVEVDGVAQSNIIILARLFAQLDNLQAEFLARKIPFRVDGQKPFFKRAEINNLVDYLRLARESQKPMTWRIGKYLINIANKPSRMLSRNLLGKLINQAIDANLSTLSILELASCRVFVWMNRAQANRIANLNHIITHIENNINNQEITAGDLLNWIVTETGYLDYFQDYYGKGEHAEEKVQAVLNFLEYVSSSRVSVARLLALVEGSDTTQGAPKQEQITFTTIFRTKGLEFDYVILPQCNEKALPYLSGEQTAIYDMQGTYQEIAKTDQMESERRLFYVGLTRARIGVLIGTSTNPSRFIQELQLQEGVTI